MTELGRLANQLDNHRSYLSHSMRRQTGSTVCVLRSYLARVTRNLARGSAVLYAAGELRIALEESVKLQSHYAELLNMHDGGSRIGFKDGQAWIARLRETGTLPKGPTA
jgi:hypothetical protein